MDFTLQASLLHLLHRSAQIADYHFDAEQRGTDGLSARQAIVLSAIGGNEGASQTEIVRVTGIDRSTMADIASRLQRQGFLIRRRTRKDARAYAMKLTQRGHEALRGAAAAGERASARLVAALPEKDRRELKRLLQTMIEAAKPAGEPRHGVHTPGGHKT